MPLVLNPEFEEIGHSCGTVTFAVRTSEEGGRPYQVRSTHCRPTRSVLVEIYAHCDGSRLASFGFNETPPPGWFLVAIASDSEGMFGRQCPVCNQYWRSGFWSTTCAYCGIRLDGLAFLTKAQRVYVQKYAKNSAKRLTLPTTPIT